MVNVKCKSEGGQSGGLPGSAKTQAVMRVLFSSLLVFVSLGMAGCAPDASAAANTAQEFHQALANSDLTKACDLLAPETRRKASSEGSTCEEYVEAAGLPSGGTVQKTETYGREASVAFDDDTIFLAISGRRWLVTAAGCTPREQLPYDCEIGG